MHLEGLIRGRLNRKGSVLNLIFEATVGPRTEDFAGLGEAKRWVERASHGRVVTFVKDFDGRERSCAMEVYENGVWRGVNIHE
jgi:hypothetical protein